MIYNGITYFPRKVIPVKDDLLIFTCILTANTVSARMSSLKFTLDCYFYATRKQLYSPAPTKINSAESRCKIGVRAVCSVYEIIIFKFIFITSLLSFRVAHPLNIPGK